MKLSLQAKKVIFKILIECGVKLAALFGSFARGDATGDSDIDLLIEFKGRKKSLFDLAALKIHLEENLGKNVDVITYNSLHPSRRDRILSEQVVLL